MKIVSRHICSFQRASIALLLGGAATWVFAMPGRAAAHPQDGTVRVTVNLQSLEVEVKDAQGNDVTGLTASDFTVLENGKPQKISFFDAGTNPASLVVLVDSSGSVLSSGRLGSAQAIAAQFMRTARPGDEISAMDFADQTGPFQQLTPEQILNPSSVTSAPTAKGGSALYDAIAAVLCHLQGSKNLQQAVVVITDGVDQHSRISLEQLTALVRSSRAELFMFGLQSRPEFNFGGHPEPKLTLVSGHDIDNPVVVFDRLIKESGAESFEPNSQRGVDDALKTVSNMLRAQYTMAYYPPDASKKIRKIDVLVDRKGARALTRRFVGSDPDPAEAVHFDGEKCVVSAKDHPYAYEAKFTRIAGLKGATYREDFSDPHSGWPDHPNSHYVPGGYQLLNPKKVSANLHANSGRDPVQSSFEENVIAAYGPWWRDFRASVTVGAILPAEAPTGSNQFEYAARAAAGLVFRLNQEGYYALLVSGATRSAKELEVKLVKRKFQGLSYAETEIIPWTKATAQGSPSGAELAVEGVGNQLAIFVDGQEVKSATDSSYVQGYTGFVISGPGQATFRNLVVVEK